MTIKNIKIITRKRGFDEMAYNDFSDTERAICVELENGQESIGMDNEYIIAALENIFKRLKKLEKNV